MKTDSKTKPTGKPVAAQAKDLPAKKSAKGGSFRSYEGKMPNHNEALLQDLVR